LGVAFLVKKNIVWLTDWNLNDKGESQSGYTQISDVFCRELVKDYNIIALGVSYRRNQHNYTFSLTNVPFAHIGHAVASIHNHNKIDHLVVALDIQMQKQLVRMGRGEIKYNGLFAVEADPLFYPWVTDIALMDNRFTISEFGKQEIIKTGLDGEHLIVPVDRKIWFPRTLDEKIAVKDILGLSDKTLLFMNADGNERKNTSMVVEAMRRLKEMGRDDFHLIILTQKKSPIAWDLDELVNRWELHKEITVLDKGLSQEEVRRLYAGADFLLNVTKAEGMSYPILEAMSVGTPVICTNATAMKDHINGIPDQGKISAFGLDANFIHIDVFGNTNRYYVYPQTLVDLLVDEETKNKAEEYSTNAQNYIEWRNSQNSIELLRKKLDE